MDRPFKRALPFVAVAAPVVACVLLILVASWRRRALIEDSVTRLAVETALARLEALHPASMDDPGFREALVQAAEAPHVVALWAFATDGRIVWSTAGFANRGTAEEHATAETRRLLDSIPEGSLSSEQRALLLAASAIQSEGEHNDVFRQMVRPIRAADSSLSGRIGVAFEASSNVGGPGLGYKIALMGIPLLLLVHGVSLVLWVFLDARERGERAWAWVALVLVANVMGLIAYLLARAPRPKGAAA